MREVNCHIPIKVCIRGHLSDAQLDELGEALIRAVAARIEQARRTLGEHGHARGHEIVSPTRDRFDPARLFNGGYGLPSYDKGGETVTVPVTGDIGAQADPWDKLSPDGRKKAQELYDECWRWISGIGDAQKAHVSVLRTGWLNGLAHRNLVEIGNLDSDDDIEDVSISLTKHTKFIAMNVVKFHEEWRTVEKRYLEEHRWLLSQKTTDTTEAAKRLEELYKEAKGWLDHGAINYITDEDYLTLKETLDKGKDIALGILRASRARAKKLKEMMEVVADLRRNGEDAEKYVPGWSRRVEEEADHLDVLSKSTSAGFAPESLKEFSNLRNELLEKREEALKAHPPEKSILEKGAEFVAGGVEAVVGIFVEAAKEAVDLVQISLHISSLGKYEPRFISDMAKAAEQGATTGQLLKGMVTGIIETPSRFLKACEDGDWEAIGRETVNLYFLAKTLKESPELVKNLSKTAVVTTNRALKILRARTVALEVEARVLPPAPTAEPKLLTTPTGAAGEAVPAGKVTEPGEPVHLEELETEAKQAKRKQEKEQKPYEEEEAEAKQKVVAKREKEKVAAKQREPEGGGKGKRRQEVKIGEKRDFAAAYDNAQEALRRARNEVRLLEEQLRDLRQRGAFAGKRLAEDDLTEALEGTRQQLSILEPAAAEAERALRESTLELHEKLGAAARNRKEYLDVARLAKGEDKIGKFKVDLTKDHIEPDHLVAIRRITTDPKFRGFEELSWDDQLEIVNMPDNLKAMKGSFNSSKRDLPWGEWPQARQYYGSEIVIKMIAAEARVEKLIIDKIAEKLPKRPKP